MSRAWSVMSGEVSEPQGLRRLESHVGGPEAEDVPVAQPLLAADPGAVDHRAVGRAEVADDIRPASRRDLGVAAAHVLVVEWDRAVAHPPDRHRSVTERDALARRQHQRTGADASGRLPQGGDDGEAPGPQLVVAEEVDPHRAHEVVALLAGVLPGGLDE